MSQYAPQYSRPYPPQYPPGDGGYIPGPSSRRPAAITVLAVIGIILGSIGVLSNVCLLGFSLTGSGFEAWPGMQSARQQGNPMAEIMLDPTYKAWSIVSGLVYLGIGVALLAGSIGALSLKPWARSTLTGYAVVAIVAGVISFVVMLMIILPAVNRMAGSAPEAMGGMVGGACGSVLGMVYPIILLVFLRRREVIAAFEGLYPSAQY